MTEATTIIERLEAYAEIADSHGYSGLGDMHDEAKAEIERLQARVREVEAAHEETAAKLNSYVCLAGSQMDEIAAGKARVQELEAVAAQAQRALKPFANCVYNANGAHTITDMYTLTAGNCSDAFLAEKRLRAVLQSPALSKETT